MKIVRFKTPAGMREGRVIDEYVLHGRTRYTVQTEFGEIYVYAEDTENVTPPQAVNRHRQKPP